MLLPAPQVEMWRRAIAPRHHFCHHFLDDLEEHRRFIGKTRAETEVINLFLLFIVVTNRVNSMGIDTPMQDAPAEYIHLPPQPRPFQEST